MKTRQWYQARIRWAEMVQGRGIRHWEEGLYLFRSEDREAGTCQTQTKRARQPPRPSVFYAAKLTPNNTS